jgi:hypothetical protein
MENELNMIRFLCNSGAEPLDPTTKLSETYMQCKALLLCPCALLCDSQRKGCLAVVWLGQL